jgi:uncharacterized damage-inducible protein DinB
MAALSRRSALAQGAGLLAGLTVSPIFRDAPAQPTRDASDELLLHEVKLLMEVDRGTYDQLANNLKGATEEEFDWKIHEEANTLRWIIGHLTWFDEWAADAIEETGMYLDDTQGPDSFQARPLAAMRERFDAAKERYVSLAEALTPADLRRPTRFVYNEANDVRYEMELRNVLQIHTTHLAGHRYQVRMVRGTYSRAHGTDKSAFDPW